uniref:C2H2-type domain-containing protein n=1 Tax=Romanomermis culicivorax TaxID=13658 RepID=A0A915IHA6_ROMCU
MQLKFINFKNSSTNEDSSLSIVTTMSQIVKRKYTCSECAKTFKNAEDMHMHAEACLLDAFEMEAHALMMNQGYSTSHSGDNIGKLASDYQLFFKPYDDAKSRKNKNSNK